MQTENVLPTSGILLIPANLTFVERIIRGGFDRLYYYTGSVAKPDWFEKDHTSNVSTDYRVKYRLFELGPAERSPEEIVSEMKRSGYNPGSPEELLALCEVAKGIEINFRVMIFGLEKKEERGGFVKYEERRFLEISKHKFNWEEKRKFDLSWGTIPDPLGKSPKDFFLLGVQKTKNRKKPNKVRPGPYANLGE